MSESFFFEFGIPFPSYHINFSIPEKKSIKEPIKFPKATHNLRFNRTGFAGRIKVLKRDTYCLYQDGWPHLTIIGGHCLTAFLATRIIKLECTSSFLYIKTKSLFVSYDYETFRVWDIKVTDFCTVGDHLYIVSDNILNAYKGLECVGSTKLSKSVKFIKGSGDYLVVVYSDNKVVLLSILLNMKGRLIYDNGVVKDIGIYKHYVLIQKYNNLSVLDLENKKTEVIKNKKQFYTANNLIIIREARGCFKYVDIENLQNTKTVLYDEIVGGIDIYNEKVFVLTRNGIHSWDETKNGDKETFINVKLVWPNVNIFNRIFYKHNLFKELKAEQAKLDYIEMGITELIKDDKDSNKNKKNSGSTTLNIKKRVSKKGGF